MKLRNKKTGEIAYPDRQFWEDSLKLVCEDNNKTYTVKTIAELNEEWEDYEEPKRTWFIDTTCCPNYIDYGDNPITDHCYDDWNELGFCFETKEEAEQAVEKLKAWKRLKDKGFRFTGFTHKDRGRMDELEIYCQLGECPEDIEDMENVHLLFGGGE